MRTPSLLALIPLLASCANTVIVPADDAAASPTDAPSPADAALPEPTPFVSSPPTDGPFARCGVLGLGTPVAVEASPDGRALAIGSNAGFVRLVRPADGANLGLIVAHTRGLTALAYAPGGASLATAGLEATTRTVRLWRSDDGAPLRTMTVPSDPVSVAFTPDGRALVVAQRNAVTALRVADGSVVWSTSVTEHPVESAALSPDGQTLAYISGGAILRMRVSDGAALDAIPDTFQRNRRTLAFSPDGASIAVGYQYYVPAPSTAPAVVARVLRLRDGAVVAELLGTQSVNALRFSPDGSSLAFGAEYAAAELWRVRAGGAWLPTPVRRVWTAETSTTRALAFGPDGATMVAVGDEHVTVLDTAAQRAPLVTIETVGSPSGALGWGGGGSVEFSPAGDQLAVGARGVVRVWALRRQSLARRIDGTRGVAAFSPDGATLATSGPGDTLRLWNRSTWAPRDTPTIADVHALTYVAGGSLVAAGSSRGIALHRATDGVEARRIAVTRQALPMFDLVASPDGALLAGATFGGWGGGLDVWRIADGQRVFTLEGNLRARSNFAFTPDATEVLVALNPSSALTSYALASGRPTTPPMTASALASVALAPDGSMVALGGANGAVTLRRWPDGALVQELGEAGPRPYQGARVLRFSPDARTLVRAGGGDTLELWCRR